MFRKNISTEPKAEARIRQLTDDFAFCPGSHAQMMRIHTHRLSTDEQRIVSIDKNAKPGTTFMSPYAEGAVAVRLGAVDVESHNQKVQAYELGRQDGRLTVVRRHDIVRPRGEMLDMPATRYVKSVTRESLTHPETPPEHAETQRFDNFSPAELLELSFVPEVLEAVDAYEVAHRYDARPGLGGTAIGSM